MHETAFTAPTGAAAGPKGARTSSAGLRHPVNSSVRVPVSGTAPGVAGESGLRPVPTALRKHLKNTRCAPPVRSPQP